MKFLIEDLIGPFLRDFTNLELGAIARAIHYNITAGPIPPHQDSLMSVLGLDEEETYNLVHAGVFVLTEPGFFVKVLQEAVLKNSMPIKKSREIAKEVNRKRYLIKGRKP